ncbi:MAG: transcription termination/antitermination factor NusG [Clostridia bacterium]|nr:transcription termination/antitermination factor NusG [Clostridia bacterium]
MSQGTAKWYVIHTYSGYEALVKDSLEKLIENNNLSDTILDIKIPMEETIEEKNGKKKVVLRKILPCYVFIKMVYSNDMWFLITNSRGVTGFVGPQGKAIPLGEDEVKKMRLEERVESCDLTIGDNVKIISGALDSFIGTVEDLNMETQKAKVKVSMFGRDTEVEVDFIQLDKIGEVQ